MSGWPAYLASSRGIIVAQIDGRGSGGEGDRRRFEMWQRLGSVEVQDQVMVLKNEDDDRQSEIGLLKSMGEASCTLFTSGLC